jgi:hypothetical protein
MGAGPGHRQGRGRASPAPPPGDAELRLAGRRRAGRRAPPRALAGGVDPRPRRALALANAARCTARTSSLPALWSKSPSCSSGSSSR